MEIFSKSGYQSAILRMSESMSTDNGFRKKWTPRRKATANSEIKQTAIQVRRRLPTRSQRVSM
jgi:hypothetical protein